MKKVKINFFKRLFNINFWLGVYTTENSEYNDYLELNEMMKKYGDVIDYINKKQIKFNDQLPNELVRNIENKIKRELNIFYTLNIYHHIGNCIITDDNNICGTKQLVRNIEKVTKLIDIDYMKETLNHIKLDLNI